ncbi:hypothetical protein NXW64_04050 [Bacteroides ovatus]|nr:hypothetical protein NXW64_04050 [Bacteroides ovatus]
MNTGMIPLVVAFTPNYFVPAATCLYSIFENMQMEVRLHIICLLSEELPERLTTKDSTDRWGMCLLLLCKSQRKITGYICRY